jgi:transcriptional regulator with XRE-family HTH domain
LHELVLRFLSLRICATLKSCYIRFYKCFKMKNQRTQELQDNFFQKIKDVLSPNASFADEIADVLNVSKDSVYRRLRNETSLSLEEIITLSEHFKVPFDLMEKQGGDAVTFTYREMNNQLDFKNYLKSIINDLSQIVQSDKKMVTYAANDIPIFHHFYFKELTAFKVFYWMKGVVNDPDLNGKRFDQNLIDPELFELTQKLYYAYCHTPSREIWTQETVNSQIEQVKYYWESGLFQSKETALLICDQMEASFMRMQQQADKGNKLLELETTEQNFWFYYAEIEIGNNTIMVERGDAKMLYLSFNTFNKMLTTNPKFCDETQKWIDNLIKKSVMISSVSEKLRFQFFDSMYRKLAVVRGDIEKA